MTVPTVTGASSSRCSAARRRWPLAARAQQPGKTARIGVFVGAGNPVMAPAYRAFLDELQKSGFSEGQNLLVDQRPTDQDLPTLTAQAAEMVRSNPDVLVALGAEPILQASLAREPAQFRSCSSPTITIRLHGATCRAWPTPGGNATGVFLRQTELAEKQVELLTQAFPGRTRLAVLWDDISAAPVRGCGTARQSCSAFRFSRSKMDRPPYDIEARLPEHGECRN